MLERGEDGLGPGEHALTHAGEAGHGHAVAAAGGAGGELVEEDDVLAVLAGGDLLGADAALAERAEQLGAVLDVLPHALRLLHAAPTTH